MVSRHAARGARPTVQSEALREFPRYWLLAGEQTAEWHNFGMEWKEHVAFLAPFLATAVAFAVLYYGVAARPPGRHPSRAPGLLHPGLRGGRVAGLFGALITKAAPVA